MQTEDYLSGPDVFTSEYGYFSSMSESWLRHSRDFVESSINTLSLGPDSFVVEVAANDGYLLQYVQAAGIPCVGIEPTHSTASAARSKGLAVEEFFLTEDSAKSFVSVHGQADLVIANNVIAHVPDVIDFTRGLAALLKPNGSLSLEFAYGVNLIEQGQFDTVYHEHFSYLTMTSLNGILAQAGLVAVDVEFLSSHGGSLRVKAKLVTDGVSVGSTRLEDLHDRENELGVKSVSFYAGIQSIANQAKNRLLQFLIESSSNNNVVVGYGAAAKGNTLLNFSGIRADLLPFVVDKSPGKVGKLLPGSRIPILPISALTEHQVDSILILPWNLTVEVLDQVMRDLHRPLPAYIAVPSFTRVGA